MPFAILLGNFLRLLSPWTSSAPAPPSTSLRRRYKQKTRSQTPGKIATQLPALTPKGSAFPPVELLFPEKLIQLVLFSEIALHVVSPLSSFLTFSLTPTSLQTYASSPILFIFISWLCWFFIVVLGLLLRGMGSRAFRLSSCYSWVLECTGSVAVAW